MPLDFNILSISKDVNLLLFQYANYIIIYSVTKITEIITNWGPGLLSFL